MRIPKDNQCRSFYNGEKVPRKVKKYFIGKKCTKKALKKRLKEVTAIGRGACGEVELSDYFCPTCGCDEEASTYHYVEWPEVWIDYYCARCGETTATRDNSPYIHVLQDMISQKQASI